MSARTITSTTIAWITDTDNMYRLRLDDDAIQSMIFSNRESMANPPNPWTRVGKATITVELFDDAKAALNAVAALRTEQKHVRAEAEKRATDIERQIQHLLAITNEVSP